VAGTILDKIVSSVREDLIGRKLAVPIASLIQQCESNSLPPARGFRKALQQDSVNIIAEVKKASPSIGVFPARLSLEEQGMEYERGGAACVSVVTEPHFFQGSLDTLRNLRQRLRLPLLRKDFIVDAYQVYEARLAGADAVLFIAAILADDEMRDLLEITMDLGMDALVEVTSKEELQRALDACAVMIGVNNRDLTNFSIDIRRSLKLAPYIPTQVTAVSESGISEYAHIAELRAAGYHGFLIGEYLMRQDKPGRALRALKGQQ
jgi:indole-3-glycerol phosphate synthase